MRFQRYLGGWGGRQLLQLRRQEGPTSKPATSWPQGTYWKLRRVTCGLHCTISHLQLIHSSVLSPIQRRPFDTPHVHASSFHHAVCISIPSGVSRLCTRYLQGRSGTLVQLKGTLPTTMRERYLTPYTHKTFLPFTVQTRRVAAAKYLSPATRRRYK